MDERGRKLSDPVGFRGSGEALPTPCYLVDEALVEENLKILKGVTDRTGARILLAQKAFSMYALYPLIGRYLCGATASGLYEARLCAEEMAGPLGTQGRRVENHIFSPAYKESEFGEVLEYCDTIVFNSWRQAERFGACAKEAGKSVGLRINPECSTQEGHAVYDPCAPGSRLGVTREAFEEALGPEGRAGQGDRLGLLDGLHFHTLCEQDSDALEKTLDAVEEKFGGYLPRMKWINFGGGHHITRPGYDIPRLERCIRRMQDRYGLTVYLEPGEAVALNAGYLVTEVLEIVHNGIDTVIVDASAACHMPDVLEMPYRPPLRGSGLPGEKAYTCRIGGPTCLAGDIIGDYSFDRPPQEGDRLVFEDMAIYSMVKNNTFNGMPLPAIGLRGKDGTCRIRKEFGYGEFKGRLS
ncbi:MAG: carboxynorspermidine decarboxylase [Lachnospiraceae bacterium]|nr:carboxynorspermidine decarboxylase [Lachnospiraceae bacterium]